jgi:hypothetical protein
MEYIIGIVSFFAICAYFAWLRVTAIKRYNKDVMDKHLNQMQKDGRFN